MLFKDLLHLFFPKLCQTCRQILSDNEHEICVQCRHDLPLTNYHFTRPEQLKQVFYGRVKLEAATALFYFKKNGKTQQLLHNLKYRGQQSIGTLLGQWLVEQMKTSGQFETIDYVIPVPLHPKREQERGYNQVSTFAQALAQGLNADYDETILIKTKHSSSQVSKSAEERWKVLLDSFSLNKTKCLDNCHILIVDDLITTGSTIEACANTLNKIQNLRLSLASIAITYSIFR